MNWITLLNIDGNLERLNVGIVVSFVFDLFILLENVLLLTYCHKSHPFIRC